MHIGKKNRYNTRTYVYIVRFNYNINREKKKKEGGDLKTFIYT